MTNGSITDRYTLYSLIVRVLHALYWKVGRENKRKQIGILRHIVLIISDLQKQDLRFQQRLKLCSCIVFMSDYQCVRCSASGSDPLTIKTKGCCDNRRIEQGRGQDYFIITTLITPSNLFSKIRQASSISLREIRCVMSGVVKYEI